jgi:hypothetical protein
MIHLAVHYNNMGVDILSSGHEETTRDHQSDNNTNTEVRQSIDRDQLSGEACHKRRKLGSYERLESHTRKEARRDAETEHRVNEALAYFQKALSLIVHTTEHHHYHGNGLKYHPNDADGFLRYENEAMEKQLVGSVNPRDMHITLKGEEGCSNQFIYWKAIKIGGDNRDNSNDSNTSNNEEEDGEENDASCSAGDFTRALNEQEQQYRQHHYHPYPQHHPQYHHQEQKQRHIAGGYESLTKSIFHSMICIYNIALCYQYKGMTTKAKHLREIAALGQNPKIWGHGATGAAAEFFLNAAVDHYTQAYELMTRFRLEDGSQYTLLMSMMNNLAATYQSLEEPTKAGICNQYLVRSLILIICSSERDGHLGQEVLSRSDTAENDEHNNKGGGGVLSGEEDRNTFESFLSNVTYLMMGGDERHTGNTTAAAA